MIPTKKEQDERAQRKNSKFEKYNNFVLSAVRRKVHEFFFRNKPPTLNSILMAVNSDPDLPDFKRTTLYELLKDLGFVYERRGKKALLLERDDIAWRHKYLHKIKKFRSENRNIVYTDETWINVGQCTSRHWKDTTVGSSSSVANSW